MESFENSNCLSMSDSISLYERYMRSFNVVDHFVGNRDHEIDNVGSASTSKQSTCSGGNIDLSVAREANDINKHFGTAETECNLNEVTQDNIIVSNFADVKGDSPCTSLVGSLLENSSTVDHSLLTEKSNPIDGHVSSEESKRNFKQPVFITSNMENSNNAVDSVPMFRDVRHGETVFKLPISELSFNGTIKHVQQLKPIVDPITALSSNAVLVLDNKSADSVNDTASGEASESNYQKPMDNISDTTNDRSTHDSRLEKTSESTGDSQYEEFNAVRQRNSDENESKWDLDKSYSSFEASFDSGVRSPDMFSDDDVAGPLLESEPFWSFLKEYEAYDKRKIKKMEETLRGVLPPPSVTILKTDVTEMLKKYHCYLPIFNGEEKLNVSEENSMTPTKRVSFVEIPQQVKNLDNLQETCDNISTKSLNVQRTKDSSRENTNELDTSVNDKTVELKMGSAVEALNTTWPDVMKCRYYDVYYNVTKYSEKFELLALKYGERYVGAETDTSVNIYSGGFQSPNSASKRKAFRLKMAHAKSPGRRLSHLARRRQAFCSAATINEKAQASNAKMVLIDKNFFPHRKLINSSERRSPRVRRTPGKKTPIRKTPGKKTPAKTPKTKSGGSSKKKAMRRLLLDTEMITRSQPTRETLKRALFISPENRKAVPQAPSTSVPINAMKSKRALFGSPICHAETKSLDGSDSDQFLSRKIDKSDGVSDIRKAVPQAPSTSVPLNAMKSKRALFGSPVPQAETKSLDGTESDQFLKRKRDALDDEPENSRSKIAKSLSFGGDNIGRAQTISLNRRASEMCTGRLSVELNETHKKKLLWAVSEALRVHGWRMSSPGFREKASSLARLTRKLLTLPPHAAKLAAPKLSTSETMLKLARQYVFAIIQGRTVDDCFQEEQLKLTNETNSKISGYISANAYQQLKAKQNAPTTFTSQIKENTCNEILRQEQTKCSTKNILQDKMINIDSNSNSSSGLSFFDRAGVGFFKSNSMPSFEEAAKMRARRQISFDNVDFPKR
ncbi:hypothetical protein K1T71_010364 [Dendrolimus kikuchii]|uniref:Uncharacterized protein n=1 Tax=Dendrolimus kikuchii TaxID=765133 RepID=A0ACC1CRE0_9NEOP|nr:hypothetical protein K1T71_010364 [Dendrolimus kikuchii]